MIDTYIKKIASITKRGDAREELFVYPKSERDDLTPEQLRQLKRVVEGEYRRKRNYLKNYSKV